MKLLFKYATRGRPEWFKDTLSRWYSLLSKKHDYQFVISIDADDDSMNNTEIKDFLSTKDNLVLFTGNSKTKIEAINADMSGLGFDILVVVSDDMIPIVAGYDDIIVQDMQRQFPTGFGALHYNDGKHGKDHLITLSIMNKALYDHFGYIYYFEYRSTWCDNEFTDVTKMLNCYWYSPQVIVEHAWMENGSDETYQKNSGDYHTDKAIYDRRKAQGFPKCF